MMTIVSLCWLHAVPVRDLSILSLLRALSVMVWMCGEKVKCGSKVTPSILGSDTVRGRTPPR